MNVELTAEEIVTLRYVLSCWSIIDGDALYEPFCNEHLKSVREKLGGKLDRLGPLCEQWKKSHKRCSGCGKWFAEKEMHFWADDVIEVLGFDCDACHREKNDSV